MNTSVPTTDGNRSKWQRLHERALTDPFLHRFEHLQRFNGTESALLDTVLALSDARELILKEYLRVALERPCSRPARSSV